MVEKSNKIYLRIADHKDVDILYEWVNDPITRKNSFSSNFISYEEHCTWFNRILHNDNKVQYILMDMGNPIGQVRIDLEGDDAEISYSIAPGERGKGYGSQALLLIIDEVKNNYKNVVRLIGQVKPENEASARAFTKQGYHETFRQFEYKIER